ncbi:hypothetical protein D3C85_1360210 [compost metagenome]
MIAGSTSDDIDAIGKPDFFPQVSVQPYFTLIALVFRNHFTNNERLLINFLQHIVRVQTLLDITSVQFNLERSSLNALPLRIHDHFRMLTKDDHLFIQEFNELVGEMEHRHRVACNNMKVLSKTNEQRAFIFSHIDRIPIFLIQ